MPLAPDKAPPRYPTAALLWDALGNVPLDRILLDPPPGAATEADVLRLEAQEDKLCELIDGTLVEKTVGFDESVIAGYIIHVLNTFVLSGNLGLVTAPDGMMRIGKRVRVPDASFISFARLPGRKSPGGPIPTITPDLAVEVISRSNSRREMAMKLEEYFATGARLVWYVDPATRTIAVYTAINQVEHLDDTHTLSGGDVLPGFAVPVAAIFDSIQARSEKPD